MQFGAFFVGQRPLLHEQYSDESKINPNPVVRTDVEVYLDQPIGSHQYKPEMWDDDHGLEIDQDVNVRWPCDERVGHVLQGKVADVSDHKMTVRGSVLIDVGKDVSCF